MKAASDRAASLDSPGVDVFQSFPYGLLLLDRDRQVQDVNNAAQDMLGAIANPRAASGLTCCELFACRARGTTLEHGCLTELALAAPGPLPEVRVDLPHGANASAAWVTAASLKSGSAPVIVELRPGDRRDRRRRSSPQWVPPSRLHIYTLGRTLVESPEGLLSGPWLGRRPGQVLKYLVCERHRPVSAEEIAEALWPGGEQRSVKNVRYLIHALRERLEPDRAKREPSRFIRVEPGGYRLNPEAVEIDADQFERAAKNGLNRLAQGDHEVAGVHLGSAATLYAGDFLAEERYALWAFPERDRLRDLACDALSALARIHRSAGELQAASFLLDRLAEMQPFDADIQREAISVAIEQGRHTVARRRYAALRRRLLEEFGHEPPFDLVDVAASVGDGPIAREP
jgi:DNA-binding SARP family transcriptional activator